MNIDQGSHIRVEALTNESTSDVSEEILLRGDVYRDAKQFQSAMECYSQVVSSSVVSKEQVVLAHLSMGYVYRQVGNYNSELLEYNKVVNMPDVEAYLLGRALLSRGYTYEGLGRGEAALNDYSMVVDLSGAKAEDVASALVRRGRIYNKKKEFDKAIGDFTRAISCGSVSESLVVVALNNRASVYVRIGNSLDAIRDCTTVIDMSKGVLAKDIVYSYFVRGRRFLKINRYEDAFHDLSVVIDFAGSPKDLLSLALVNRVFLWFRYGNYGDVIADCNKILGFSDLDVCLKIKISIIKVVANVLYKLNGRKDRP